MIRNSLFIKFIFPLFWIIFSNPVSSQYTQIVKGTVIDKDSKMPLSDVSILIETSTPNLGSSTDKKGTFRIENVSIGRHRVRVSKIGYETSILSEIAVNSGKEVVLSIELSESVSQLNEVVISEKGYKGNPDNEMANVSARSFSVEEAGRFAGNLNNDVSRIAQSYAGVTMSDQSNELVIRGNSSKGMLWRLEGIEVPNLNHLANDGSSGGGLSLLSVNVFRNSDFFTGAFPAEYGNALSGVFDVKLRNGNSDKYEFAFQGGFLGLEAAAEGPFKKGSGASFLANYRYSTMGLFNKLGFNIVGVAIPKFHDVTVKINYPIKSHSVLQFYCVSGLSSVTIPASIDSLMWESSDDRYQPTVQSNMVASGLIFKNQMNEKINLNFSLSFSGNSLIHSFDSLNNNYSLINVSKQNYSQSAFRISSNMSYKLNSKKTIKLGLIYSLINFDLYSDNKANRMIFIDKKGSGNTAQFYIDFKYRLTEKICIHSGFHSLYFNVNSNLSFEPRLGIEWYANKIQTFGFGFGVHSKSEPLTFYFADIPLSNGTFGRLNSNLKPTKAIHYVVSHQIQFSKSVRLKTELYYQKLFDVPVENDLQSGFSVLNYGSMYSSDIDNSMNVALVNKGSGENYGVEFTLERFFSKQYYYLVTLSLFDSKYKALDNIERNTRYNTNFITNCIAGKEFSVGEKGDKTINVDIKLIFCGGDRLTPILLDSSITTGKTVFDLNKRYNLKAPNYFRVDFKFGFCKNNSKSTHYVYLDVQNVSNKKNLYYQFFDVSKNKVANYYHLGLIPILN